MEAIYKLIVADTSKDVISLYLKRIVLTITEFENNAFRRLDTIISYERFGYKLVYNKDIIELYEAESYTVSKEERKEIYKSALHLINTGQNRFCCDAIGVVIQKEYLPVFPFGAVTKDLFPELHSFKPANHGMVWWSMEDKDIRIRVLTKCIEMCE